MKTKIFYIYGVFFIIFVAACFLWMIRNDTFAEKATYISYRDKDIEKELGYTLEEYVKTKSIITLQLNGNEKYDISILNRFQLEIQKIKKEENPNKGIHLKFGKKTTYENVIRSFQICKIEDCATYAPDGYDFWVFPYYKKTYSKLK
ncbi:hypothetical protein IRZ71_08290 [Flavobacterium sp. ANB]|uniref:hypothetical protein n=1 Tax=unclassified Flavobacterium TaxID=196869 RepID=UPI0012B8A7B5|nr:MULTISPECIES: hypothetical protein [unclassified Flavobacterium]MBF4516338.1 hypothetical protein [Flavobacterium sp. ANB]MTD69765.1 hypothetical protein [Flavobacterium sp. LC2016-13]